MSLTVQFQTMVAMVIMGIWVGIALETYGRFLNRPKRMRWFVFLNDCLFWILQGLIIFYILLSVNEGELRFYVFIALLCGYAAYQGLFRELYRKFLEKTIKTTINIYSFFYRVILTFIVKPIKIIIQSTIALILVLANFIFATVQVIYKIVLTPIRWLFKLFWKLIPKRVKMFLSNKAGILTKAKNIIIKWWKKLRR